ncbi:MAG: hypothetical protein J7K87_00755 [Candidatus Aenigmarchaeota archaeon]|nr:hypothetical protein [Candidatus Aenigmarchaeota archaeon]
MDSLKIDNALLSVYDKTGIVDFAKFLRDYDVNIVSTGGTRKVLEDNNLNVTSIEEFGGNPEIMGGRVKTLQYKVHAAILYRDEDIDELKQHGIKPFNMVVCNFYPFQETVNSGESKEKIIEMIDIGGPTMVSAAAKNYKNVAVVSDPSQYGLIEREMEETDGLLSLETREWLASEAENKLADYFVARANWRNSQIHGDIPDNFFLSLKKRMKLPYGENPGQEAAAYSPVGYTMGVLGWKKLGGTEPSFNKLREAAKINKLLQGFELPTAITGKHGIISGIGMSRNGIEHAYKIAHDCDVETNLGNETMLNRECTKTASKMIGLDLKNKWTEDLREFIGEKSSREWTVFTEGIGAPSYEDGTVDILLEKQKKKITIFQTGPYSNFPYDIRVEDGAFLMQNVADYNKKIPRKGRWVTSMKGNEEIEDKLFLMAEVVRRIPSNGIFVGDVDIKNGEIRELRGYGIGTSTKRSGAVKMALENAGERARSALMASDGFFPYPDSLDIAAEYGISYIIVPEGGIRKDEVVRAANEYGIGIYFLDHSIRLFSH